MTTDNLELHISGASKMPGGEYASVRISGSGKITGNLLCGTFSCSGAGKVEGDLVCRELAKSSGSTKIEGDFEANAMMVSGAFKVAGNCVIHTKAQVAGKLSAESDLNVSELELAGVCKVDGAVCGTAFNISGCLDVENGVEAEQFYCAGVSKIGGLLNAETVRLEASSQNKIRSIGGSVVEVLPKGGLSSLSIFRNAAPCLCSELVEADTITLTRSVVEVVRGGTVSIGPDCEIGVVEYSQAVHIDPSAQVRSVVRLAAQAALPEA